MRAGIGGRVEGVHSVAAAVAAGRVRKLWVDESRSGRAPIEPILTAARAAGVEVSLVADVAGMATTDAPQGIVADAEPILPVPLEDVVVATEPAAVLVLDHLTDPRNVGAIARSALAAGVRGLVSSSRRAAPLDATAFKAAAGAFEHLAVAVVSSIPDALSRLRNHDLWIVGLSAGADSPLVGLDLLAGPVAVVIGAEGKGLSRLAAARCDLLAGIPMAPEVESLNAAVASALAVFEIRRMRSVS